MGCGAACTKELALCMHIRIMHAQYCAHSHYACSRLYCACSGHCHAGTGLQYVCAQDYTACDSCCAMCAQARSICRHLVEVCLQRATVCVPRFALCRHRPKLCRHRAAVCVHRTGSWLRPVPEGAWVLVTHICLGPNIMYGSCVGRLLLRAIWI